MPKTSPSEEHSARRKAELDELQLRRTVGIGTDGNSASGLARQSNEIDAHILAVRIRIDLDRFIKFGSDRKYSHAQSALSPSRKL